MRKSWFRKERITEALQGQEVGVRTENFVPGAHISSGTLYKWRAKFGGLEILDTKRPAVTAGKSCKLKKLAESLLDNAALNNRLARNQLRLVREGLRPRS